MRGSFINIGVYMLKICIYPDPILKQKQKKLKLLMKN